MKFIRLPSMPNRWINLDAIIAIREQSYDSYLRKEYPEGTIRITLTSLVCGFVGQDGVCSVSEEVILEGDDARAVLDAVVN